jgi:hypothetical protein
MHSPRTTPRPAWVPFLSLLAAVSAPAATTGPVGYVTGFYDAGYNLVGSPFNLSGTPGSSTLVQDVFAAAPPAGTTFFTYLTGSYTSYTYDGVAWQNGAGTNVGPFTLGMQFGAILYLPEATDILYSGEVSWVTGLDESGPLVTIPVAAPYSNGIHLLANVNPVDAVGFEALIGRSPVDGDAVLRLTPSGDPLVSLFSGGLWSSDPTIEVGESAFFDLSGNGFSGFTLPAVVPEPTSGLLAMTGIVLLLAKRRRA